VNTTSVLGLDRPSVDVSFCRQRGNITVAAASTPRQIRAALALASDMLRDGASDDVLTAHIPQTTLLASVSNEPAGIAVVHRAGPQDGQIAWMYVRPRARRLGVGHVLLATARRLAA
jgi:GNAT superfamily N-acetyltransferase